MASRQWLRGLAPKPLLNQNFFCSNFFCRFCFENQVCCKRRRRAVEHALAVVLGIMREQCRCTRVGTLL